MKPYGLPTMNDLTATIERRAEQDRRQHYGDQARIAELEAALRALLDAQAHHQGHHERVSAAAMARAVLEKST